ncbi:E3 ubiquitin-protein ligase Topors [Harpegnathos saltator]|uniref:E3 ubiquitin-protein ligase Topors n=1 Tax=Harpegnathos saltator TaxID=610380 RepID=UPI000590B282|nr:E3 ubiquitin-protein ligase Topors [Harpegnathos saltator]XP_011139583.1 E3 ubiquitin-protein ligase Topors [Harpegnathos saltator]XP_011139584.1 E3 ubiquitin-protein ligase Topors [Harpegnathos saltator]
MEGSLEVKHSLAGVEEPIKSEAPVQNSDSNERSDDIASPPPNCSICLGKLINTSFTDSCLHQFCFDCLVKWSKIKTECPLCKQTFKSIIHSVRSEEDYDQYHVPRELAQSQIPQPHVVSTLDLNLDVGVGRWEDVPRFVYRTTMTGNRRHGLLNPEQVARREQLPSVAPQVPREERRRRRDNPTDYRRTVYRHGIWATLLPDIFGRFRECSAEYYRRYPQELDRLIPWLNRELQVLLANSTHITYVMNIILDALRQFDIRSTEFRNLVRPYFDVHTDHFAHELLNFARTNFDMVGYDQAVTYLPRGLSNEYAPRIVSPTSSTSSSSSSSSSHISFLSDNSDVRILEDEAIDLRVNTVMPTVLPMSQPGPSAVGQLLRSLESSYDIPELLVLSSTSSESEGECEIIGYVKPRHERTPEIIELVSSDNEMSPVRSNENIPSTTEETVPANLSLPSTSYATKEISSDLSSSSTSADDNSDSDYNPGTSRRFRNHSKKLSSRKFVEKEHKKMNKTRSHNKRSRNSYSSEESDFKKRSSRKIVKKRIYSSSDSSSSEGSSTKYDEKRSKKERCSVKEQMKLKKEETYPNADGDSDSSTETDSKTKTKKCDRQYVSKRKRSLSSSDYTAKSERTTRSKDRICTQEKSKSNNKDNKCRQSRSRSTSLSSNVSEQDKVSGYRHHESRGRRPDDSASTNKVTKRQSESKSKSKTCYFSDSDDDHLRSSSQCSNRSNKSYLRWRRSKYKDRHKDKDRTNRSSSRTFNSSQEAASPIVTSSTSAKNDAHPTKHSDCVESHKSTRSEYKKSKHRKFHDEKKSRSRKRRRRLRSLSTSQSE